MITAKVLENGLEQAITLPKECHISEDEVFVNKVGEIVMLIPKSFEWGGFLNSLNMFSDDFMENGREQGFEQARESL